MNNTTAYYNWLLETEKINFADIGYYIGFYLRHKFLIQAKSIKIKNGDDDRNIMYINEADDNPLQMIVLFNGLRARVDCDQTLPLYFDYMTMLCDKRYAYEEAFTFAEVLRVFEPNSEIVYYVNSIKIKIIYKFLISINQKILSNELLYIIAQYMA